MNQIKDELLVVTSVTHCANRHFFFRYYDIILCYYDVYYDIYRYVAQFVSLAYIDLI